MAADFSRVRLNPLLDYAGVELKQGGVLLDADANELVAIIDRRLRALASDTLGRATVSSTTPDAFKITVAGAALRIGRGRLYVDGLLAENHGAPSADAAKRVFDSLLAELMFTDDVGYNAQPYLPNAPALPVGGRHLVYLDVWNREVTHLEEPDLVESAVAVETSARLQTVWQVRVLAESAGTSTTCASPDSDLPGWAVLIAPSTGVLTTGTFEVPATDDPCELPPTGGYRGLENQLYRVEIHDPGQPGTGATFKWSRENGSVGSRVASIVSGSELELETLGRDDVLRLNTGDWVEITDNVREFSQSAGEMRRITVNDATRRITFTPALPAGFLPGSFPNSAFPKARDLRVRRWDQKGLVFRTDASGTPVQVQDLDAAGSTGLINVPSATTTLLLENGVTVRFDSTGAKGFKAGDYWVFAARTADASVEVLDRAPPRGVHHHYARLALWDVGAGTVTDCRNPWPPVAGGADCICTACVTPESHASGQLTIQAAVDRVRDTGGTICLHPGQYVLREPVRIAAARSLRLRGQGPATVLVAPGSAFVVERSIAVAIESLAVISLGQRSAISVDTVLGLALRELVLGVLGGNDARGAGIALAGLIAGASIDRNLIIAPEGIRAGEGIGDERGFLFTAALRIEDNVLSCQRTGVALAGLVAHLYDTSLRGNQLLGCRSGALIALGIAGPGASMRFTANNLSINGAGIVCGTDGAWIESNKISAVRQGDRQPTGAGIALATGLDRTGSDQCQILANQVSGFPDAGILIQAPAAELIVKLNIIEQCGNGIVMTDAARAGAVSIENNHLRAVGAPAGAGDFGAAAVGIGVVRTQAATIAGNVVREVALQPAQSQVLIGGVVTFAVLQARIVGNEISAIGPAGEFNAPTAGIMVRAPYAQAEVTHNRVERDATPTEAPVASAFWALLIDEPVIGGNLVSRAGRFTAVRIDETRTLVIHGKRAFVNLAGVVVDVTGAAAARGTAASVLGNTLVARGRVPAVDVMATAETLFSDNRCELRNRGPVAVLLVTPVAIVNANRVRGGEESIRVQNGKAVAAIGNITTGTINPLQPEMQPLNLRA